MLDRGLLRGRARPAIAIAAFFGTALSMSASTLSAEPIPMKPGSQVAVEAYLAAARNRPQVRAAVGVPAVRCLEASDSTEICEWSLSDREVGWEPLSEAIDTRDRVRVLCALPRDGSDRSEGSCTAHPQRSNRTMFAPQRSGPSARKGPMKRVRAIPREEGQRIARAWLDAATDLVEMSRLLGAVPNGCRPPADDVRVCLWRATARTYGHGTLAASIGASGSKKIRHECRFPADGSPRGADSCSTVIGH